MRLYMDRLVESYHGQVDEIKPLKGRYIDAVLALINGIPKKGYITADTCVSDHIFLRSRQHVMVVDCDGMNNMLAAVRSLKLDNIAYMPIQSSPEHFWIVADYIGTIKDVVAKMRTIPGADSDHTYMASQHKAVFLRAMPRFKDSPVFLDDDSMLSPPVQKWYREFKGLYDTHGKRIRAAFELKEALINGTIGTLASDPAFAI